MLKLIAVAIALVVGAVSCVDPPQVGFVEPTAPTTTTTVVAQAPEQSPVPFGTDPDLNIQRVIDGDTVVLNDDRRVRLAQVNSPETDECFGPEATRFVQSLVDRSVQVTLQRPATSPQTDRYGRTVAEVLVFDGASWLSLNEEIVRNGYGTFATRFASEDRALAQRLRGAQTQAQGSRLGLWSSCD